MKGLQQIFFLLSYKGFPHSEVLNQQTEKNNMYSLSSIFSVVVSVYLKGTL